MKNQYENKTPEQVWNEWTPEQRDHFIFDHTDRENVSTIELHKKNYDELPDEIKMELKSHIRMGQYAKGGPIDDLGEPDITENYYRFRLRSPEGVEECRIPEWAVRVAESVKKGAKITTCKKDEKWFVQNVMIPTEGVTVAEAKKYALQIIGKLKGVAMREGGNVENWEVKQSSVGTNKGWHFTNHINFSSALYKTKEETEEKLKQYLKTGKFDWYGSAEMAEGGSMATGGGGEIVDNLIKKLKQGIAYYMPMATSSQRRERQGSIGTAISYTMIDPRLRNLLSREEYLVGFHYGLIGNNGHDGTIIKNADNIDIDISSGGSMARGGGIGSGWEKDGLEWTKGENIVSINPTTEGDDVFVGWMKNGKPMYESEIIKSEKEAEMVAEIFRRAIDREGANAGKLLKGLKMAKGGNVGNPENFKVVKIKIPKGKEYLLDNYAYDLIQIIEKSLTDKWFGYGRFQAEIQETISPNEIKVWIKIPTARLNILDDGGYEFIRTISKALTKKWFGHGAFDVELLNESMAKGGEVRSVAAYNKLVQEKENIVKNLSPKQVADMWNKEAGAVKGGVSEPVTEEWAKTDVAKMYLRNLLIEKELTEAEYNKYFAQGGGTSSELKYISELVRKGGTSGEGWELLLDMEVGSTYPALNDFGQIADQIKEGKTQGEFPYLTRDDNEEMGWWNLKIETMSHGGPIPSPIADLQTIQNILAAGRPYIFLNELQTPQRYATNSATRYVVDDTYELLKLNLLDSKYYIYPVHEKKSIGGVILGATLGVAGTLGAQKLMSDTDKKDDNKKPQPFYFHIWLRSDNFDKSHLSFIKFEDAKKMYKKIFSAKKVKYQDIVDNDIMEKELYEKWKKEGTKDIPKLSDESKIQRIRMSIFDENDKEEILEQWPKKQ